MALIDRTNLTDTDVTVTTASTVVVAADTSQDRCALTIQNNGSVDVDFRHDGVTAVAGVGMRLIPGASAYYDKVPINGINGIVASGTARVTVITGPA